MVKCNKEVHDKVRMVMDGHSEDIVIELTPKLNLSEIWGLA